MGPKNERLRREQERHRKRTQRATHHIEDSKDELHEYLEDQNLMVTNGPKKEPHRKLTQSATDVEGRIDDLQQYFEDQDLKQKLYNERRSRSKKITQGQKESISRTVRRKRKEVTEREAAADKERRKEKRKNLETRQVEASRETPARSRKRKNPKTRQIEAVADKERRSVKRQDQVIQEQEAARETPARSRKRKNLETRQVEAARETPARSRKRKNIETRQVEASRETPARSRKRKNPETRQIEAVADKERRSVKRQDQVIQEQEAARETPARSRKRKNPETRQAETVADKERRRVKKQDEMEPENAVKTFQRHIKTGPVYVCTCCQRLLYKHSVTQFHEEAFADLNSSFLTSCRTKRVSSDNLEYICSNCKNSMKKNELPMLSVANNMGLDDIPEQLLHLNSLEVTFIARRISFMKLLALPRGKQKCVHGCVVNIPIEADQCVSLLPRVPSSASMVMVKLKRKLQYRGHVYQQNINPQKVLEALHVLMSNNPLYSDVALTEDWLEECNQDAPDIWSSLTAATDSERRTSEVLETETDALEIQAEEAHETQNTHEMQAETTEMLAEQQEVQDCPPSESDEELNDEETEDERSQLRGLPFNTCIQPKDISADTNMLLSIAPGEGNRPLSFDADEHAEELSFPHLFPSGKFGFSMPRKRNVPLKKYFQARLLNADGRFASNIEYIFAAQYRCEAKEIRDCLSVALRKGKQKDITAGDLKQRIRDYVRNDLGVHFLQKVRGSPAYFNKMLYDLFAMIRQLGPCTWFITLSAADLKWPDTIKVIAEQQGKQLSDEDIEGLSWEQRCEFLRSNPVTAARHFDNRVQLFLKYILLNKSLKPLGEITDYKYRIEFQQRGSPHVHMLAWIKGAPNFEENTVEQIQQFIDRNITCELPKEDEKMRDLLSLVMKHSHSITCRKHGETCRFHFPRPPLRHTLAVKPLDEQPTSGQQEKYSDILQAVYDQLSKLDFSEDVDFDQLLEKASVNEDNYIAALKWIKTKNGQPAILLKRTPSEVNINNYNTTLMQAWEANLDVQYVTNTYACVMYVASYVSKPEKTLGDVLKAVSSSAQHLGPKSAMKNVAKKFLTHREVSAQEAIYRLLSLPLIQGSRQIVFLPTDFPENRTRLMKPLKVIEALEDDDPDVYIAGMIDKYSARPATIEDICFAEFAARYRLASRPVNTDVGTEDREDEEADQVDENADADPCPKTIRLKQGLGTMVCKGTPSIVRYHQWSQKKEPDHYFYSQLLLYLPWRDEKKDFPDSTYRDKYLSKLDVIERNRQRYEHNSDELARAMSNMEEFGAPEESWAVLAPQTQQMQGDDEHEGVQAVANVSAAFDNEHHRSVERDIGVTPYEIEFTHETMTVHEWYELLLSLNILQTQVHDFIVDWCSKMLLSHKQKKPDPFHLFLTGGAGVGKSHLVRGIVQTVNQMFSRNNQSEEMHILVCAPTGAAAYNITGYTLHAAFLLPLLMKHTDDYIPLSGDKLASLKEMMGSVKIVVIDEISMVGADMLLTVHRRLCDVMGNEEPFGGVSILAVGDLLQLPPVAQKPVFAPPSDEMAAIYGSLWQNLFHIVELQEIQRQKNDVSFASMLNRVREGLHTKDDLQTLKSRQIDRDSPDYPSLETHIFAYNKDVQEHNLQRLESFPGQKFTFKSEDSRRDDQTGSINTSSFKDMSGGLPNAVTLTAGARVMLTKNLDVQDGLVNSAAGVVTGFFPEPDAEQDPDTFKPKYIFVQFDNDRVGRRSRLQSQGICPDQSCTPITTVECQIRLGKYSRITGKRVQFPLCLAWAVTIHKEQGKTEDKLVVSCNGTFHVGQFYTAISRTKTLDGLYMLNEVTSRKIKVNTKALEEIQRMKKVSPFEPVSLDTADPVVTKSLYFKVQCLNVNSLRPHLQSMDKDGFTENCHISCLSETWLKSSDAVPEFTDFTCIRTDSNQSSNNRSGGLLMLIHHDLRLLRQDTSSEGGTEYQVAVVAFREDTSQRMCIVSVYHNPKITATEFLPHLERIILRLPQGLPVCVLGDFNIDMSTTGSSSTNLSKLMQYHGFYPCVSVPTHRRGGLLDNVFLNFLAPERLVDVVPKYFTDHSLITCAIPLKDFIHL